MRHILKVRSRRRNVDDSAQGITEIKVAKRVSVVCPVYEKPAIKRPYRVQRLNPGIVTLRKQRPAQFSAACVIQIEMQVMLLPVQHPNEHRLSVRSPAHAGQVTFRRELVRNYGRNHVAEGIANAQRQAFRRRARHRIGYELVGSGTRAYVQDRKTADKGLILAVNCKEAAVRRRKNAFGTAEFVPGDFLAVADCRVVADGKPPFASVGSRVSGTRPAGEVEMEIWQRRIVAA